MHVVYGLISRYFAFYNVLRFLWAFLTTHFFLLNKILMQWVQKKNQITFKHFPSFKSINHLFVDKECMSHLHGTLPYTRTHIHIIKLLSKLHFFFLSSTFTPFVYYILYILLREPSH